MVTIMAFRSASGSHVITFYHQKEIDFPPHPKFQFKIKILRKDSNWPGLGQVPLLAQSTITGLGLKEVTVDPREPSGQSWKILIFLGGKRLFPNDREEY